MAEEINSHNRSVRQDRRIMLCVKCGNSCQRITNRQKYCPACQPLMKKVWYRAWADANQDRNRKVRQAWAEANRDKSNQRKSEWADKNGEKARASKLRWQSSNPDKARALCRKWYYANLDRARASARSRARRRIQSDPRAKLHHTMSRSIGQSLRTLKAGKPWEAILGYTVLELQVHLERQFYKGMTWQNHGRGNGKWHVDHIVPKSSFSFESPDDPEFKACWAMTNLRPLWSQDNLSKSKKRLHLI
jgi:hypothetical protein